MAFRTNTSKASEGNSIKPEGDYEVIIDSAEIRVTAGGKENINLVYVIRNDVGQEYRNGLIFHSIWKKNEPNPDDMSIGGFNYAQLMAVANAARLPDGKEYADLNEFLAELEGKPIKVHLYHNDYNGKTYEKVNRHMPTEFPSVKHKAKTSAAPVAPAKPAGYSAPFAQAAPTVPATGGSDDNYPF